VSDGRGSAYASSLNEGALDLVITNEDAPPTVFKNLAGTTHRWLMLQLLGTKSNRDAIGARVSATAGSLRLVREVTAGSSYAAQSMLPVHFGLGDAATVDTLEIRWPSGAVETFRNVPGNQYLTVVEGEDALEPTRVARPAGAPRRPWGADGRTDDQFRPVGAAIGTRARPRADLARGGLRRLVGPRQPEPGRPRPDFSLKDLGGNKVAIKNLRGKLVLPNFWATYCDPCREEMPDLMALYATYRARNVLVVGITLDEMGEAAVRPFVEVLHIGYLILLGNSETFFRYRGFGIPMTVLIGRDGRIAHKWVGAKPREEFELLILGQLSTGATRAELALSVTLAP
jgi:peroxiredoxin